jgi:thymidine kinase
MIIIDICDKINSIAALCLHCEDHEYFINSN